MLLLSLAQARLCLDCDWLTDETFCPKCDRDSTVPLAAWFRPLRDDGEPDGGGRRGRRRRGSGRWLIVVQHQQQELFRTLRNALEDTDVEVLYERRAGDRRRRPGTAVAERRRTERRRRRATALVYERTEARTPVTGERTRVRAPVPQPV
jgi:hypothetical protein